MDGWKWSQIGLANCMKVAPLPHPCDGLTSVLWPFLSPTWKTAIDANNNYSYLVILSYLVLLSRFVLSDLILSHEHLTSHRRTGFHPRPASLMTCCRFCFCQPPQSGLLLVPSSGTTSSRLLGSLSCNCNSNAQDKG